MKQANSNSEQCSPKGSHKKAWKLLAAVLVVGILIGAVCSYLEVKKQLARASALKADMAQLGQCLLSQDVEGAQQAVEALDVRILEIQESLSSPFWRLAENVPVLGGNVTTAGEAVQLLQDASATLMGPAVEQLRNYPLHNENFSLAQAEKTAQSYMAFLLERLPEAQRIVHQANTLELGLLDRNGRLKEALAVADLGIQFAQSSSEKVLIPLLEWMQQYPVAQWSFKTLVNPDFLDACHAILEQAIPFLEETLSELSKSETVSVDLLTTGQQLLSLSKGADAQLLQPLCAQLRAYPLSSIRVEDGFHAAILARYIAFAEEIMPDAERILFQILELPLEFLHTNEKIAHVLLVANNLTALYHESADIISFAKVFLAEGQDRTYLLVAQNSAETRASGGFPGAMGRIQIRDGVLTVGDFAGVNDCLAVRAPNKGNFTSVEAHLFRNAIQICRDACFCPDFERVAEIWALGYEAKNGESLDGIISMTPAIIQQIMSPGDKLVLFDGTELTWENAARVLQRDLYFQYFTPGSSINRTNTVVDALFAQTAKAALNQMLSGLGPGNVLRYLEVMRKDFADRTLMIWMKQEQEQAMIREFGWSGGLNRDPDSPQVGVYFSNTLACKLGWFLEIDTQIGQPVVNSDGSRTYPVTVQLSNIITKEEIKAAHAQYILGGDGRIIGAVHLFAPAGGGVANFDSNFQVKDYQYHGLSLGYFPRVVIAPGQTQTITCEITTAPGVDTPLTVSQTPTLQEYH